ncbi:MAG TPA: DinB family protein [Longimicrobiales bacterium]|nr:DinB family protein [Longimicrobiales bacterium]
MVRAKKGGPGGEAGGPGAPHEDGLLAQILEAWAVNNRINLILLDHIDPDGLATTLSTRGGRDVSRQLAHMHTVRLAWLDSSGGRDLSEGLPRFESKEHPSGDALKEAFEASGTAISTFLRDHAEGRRSSKGLRRGVGVLFAYLVAHEAHHRGSILLTLKQCGHKLDERLRWGIWDWQRL